MFCDELIKVKVLEGLYAKNGKPVAAVLCGPSGATLVKNGGEIARNLRNLQTILGEVITACDSHDRQYIYDYFTASKKRRDSLLENAAKEKIDPN